MTKLQNYLRLTSINQNSATAFTAAELKDLFTVQTRTNGCLTRKLFADGLSVRSLTWSLADDLLECECLQEQVRKYNLDEDSKVPSEASDDDEDLPDLRDLSAKKDTDVGNDSGSVSDEEEEPAFVAASQYEGKPVSLT
jgi:hypothetical protein